MRRGKCDLIGPSWNTIPFQGASQTVMMHQTGAKRVFRVGYSTVHSPTRAPQLAKARDRLVRGLDEVAGMKRYKRSCNFLRISVLGLGACGFLLAGGANGHAGAPPDRSHSKTATSNAGES